MKFTTHGPLHICFLYDPGHHSIYTLFKLAFCLCVFFLTKQTDKFKFLHTFNFSFQGFFKPVSVSDTIIAIHCRTFRLFSIHDVRCRADPAAQQHGGQLQDVPDHPGQPDLQNSGEVWWSPCHQIHPSRVRIPARGWSERRQIVL